MSNPVEVLAKLRNSFNSGKTKSFEFREKQLKSLLRLLDENESAILKVLDDDLKKCKQECVVTEIHFTRNDIVGILDNLEEWMKPENPEKTFINIMDEVLIINEPYGVVLIIGAWNYPLQLVLAPLVAAIAAGNCAIIKPSEVAPSTAKLISELLAKYLDPDCYHTILGGVNETTQLLKLRFDYIFFTGSTSIAKHIYKAASEFLTPVTLELGGKSPVYLDDSVDIDIAANRVLWGKFLNSGQTCIGPDYLICSSKQVEQKFIEAAKKVIKEWYGDKIQESPDFGRIINDAHFKRILKLIENTKIAIGGNYDSKQRFIEPTIITDVNSNDPIMEDEIFAPVLPIMVINNLNDVISFINSREKPLALYIFSKNQTIIDQLLNGTSSGGVCINDTIMHIGVDTLPFGGVGNSGIGAYHGKYSFDTFTHKRSVLVKKIDKFGEYMQKSRYPPYNEGKLKFITTMMKKRKSYINTKYLLYFIVFGFGVISTLASKCVLKYFYEDRNK